VDANVLGGRLRDEAEGGLASATGSGVHGVPGAPYCHQHSRLAPVFRLPPRQLKTPYWVRRETTCMCGISPAAQTSLEYRRGSGRRGAAAAFSLRCRSSSAFFAAAFRRSSSAFCLLRASSSALLAASRSSSSRLASTAARASAAASDSVAA